jgi:hypothetical protein
MELLWLWLLTRIYGVLFWRLGGQTLGMRPGPVLVVDRS